VYSRKRIGPNTDPCGTPHVTRRVIIPTSLRRQLLELAHEGHPGIGRMKYKCRDAIWWPGLDSDLERFVRDCTPCVVSGKSTRPTPGPLQPVRFPAGPWRKLSLDIAGEFVAVPSCHRFMIVAIDYYSKWPEVATCSSVTSGVVIEFLNRSRRRYRDRQWFSVHIRRV